MGMLVRAPSGCDRLISGATARVLDGVRIIPELGERMEGGTVSAPEGAVQRAVRYSSLAERLTVSGALRISTMLQRLQGSIERSLLTSALLSGVMTTLALLFIALLSR